MTAAGASLRIGLTMRTADARDYDEPRDALARGWTDFMARCLPEASWLPIPNLGDRAVAFAQDWDLDDLILTGGDDVGAAPLRDRTERALLDYFAQSERPVFGVCRGLQLMQSHFGGALEACDAAAHVAQRHEIRFVDEVAAGVPGIAQAIVNSYHTLALKADAVAQPLRPLAVTDDGWAEACHWPGRPLVAVMWHPEREAALCDLDRALVRHTFGLDPGSAG